MSWRSLLVVLLCLCVLPGASLGKKKSASKKKPGPVQAQMKKVLDGQGEAVMKCAASQMTPGGPSAFEVTADLVINNLGQVLTCQVTTNIQGPPGEQLRSCVDKVLHAAPFPKSAPPLIKLDRTWKFSLQ